MKAACVTAVVLTLLACATRVPLAASQADATSLRQATDVNAATFEETIKPNKLPWILSTDASQFEDKAVARKAEGLARMGVFDFEDSTLLQLMGVESGAEPSLVYVIPYQGPEAPEDTERIALPAESFEAALEAVRASLPEDMVTVLSSSIEIQQNLLKALENRQLLCVTYTDKEGVPDLLLKLALWTGDNFKFLLIPNPSPEEVEQAGIQKLPEVHLMVPQPAENGQVNFGSVRYEKAQFGSASFKNVARFLTVVREQFNQNGFLDQLFEASAPDGQKKAKGTAPSGAGKFDSEPVFEVTSETTEYCSESKLGLCVIAMIDGSPSNEEKQRQIDILTEVQNSPANKGRPLHFMWVDVTCHPGFADAFGVAVDLVPTAVAVSPRKQKFAQLLGAYTAGSLSEFIGGVLSGRTRIAPYSQLPAVSEDDDCEAAHANMAAPVEEEVDLDDIMSEILEEERQEREELEKATEAAVTEDESDLEAKRRRAMEEMERLNKKSKSRRRRRRRRRRSAKKDEL